MPAPPSEQPQDLPSRISLITRNSAEAVGPTFTDRLSAILCERPLRAYLGTATTGCPHYAYFVPILKVRDLLAADCDVTILIADLHGMLDANKSDFALLSARSEFYEKLIALMLRRLSIAPAALSGQLRFVRGSSFQLSGAYTLDLYKMLSKVTLKKSLKAGSEVVKTSENPELGCLVYPLMQALDEKHLQTDLQLGGLDQRKIFIFAEENHRAYGYKKTLHLMTPILPGLVAGKKMSASDAESKIDFVDSDQRIRNKVRRALAEEGSVERTPLLESFRLVVFEVLVGVVVRKDPKFGGGERRFESYAELEEAYRRREVHPGDLKNCLAECVIELVRDIRKEIFEGELTESFVLGYKEMAKRCGIKRRE